MPTLLSAIDSLSGHREFGGERGTRPVDTMTQRLQPNQERRRAVGLFTLDIQAHTGARAFGRQYCTQVLLPILKAMASDRALRVSIAATGIDLEFVGQECAAPFEVLKSLVKRGQVELVSCLYSPFAWWNFPAGDLLRSIDLNQRRLEALGVATSRTFMAPGGHWGYALAHLGDRYQAVICRGEAVRSISGARLNQLAYSLGGSKVVLAGGDIREVVNRYEMGGARGVAAAAGGWGPTASLAAGEGSAAADCPSSAWYWVHCGGLHALAVPQRGPELGGLDALLNDFDWQTRCFNALAGLVAEGFEFAHPGELATSPEVMSTGSAPMVPPIIDSAPNWAPNEQRPPKTSAYVPYISLAWRARNLLLACEAKLADGASPDRAGEYRRRIEDAWRERELSTCYAPSGSGLQLAETPKACSNHSMNALSEAALLADELAPCVAVAARAAAPRATRVAGVPPVVCETFGTRIETQWWETDHDGIFLAQFMIAIEDDDCGVSFRAAEIHVPSVGQRGQSQQVLFDGLNKDDLVLPLPESYLGVGDGIYIVRINSSWPGPAFISRGKPWVWFVAEGYPAGRQMEWRFLVLKNMRIETVAAIASAANQL